MLKKPILTWLLALFLAVIFAGGLARLFALRYESGDIYPLYSSLRADPLGTKALAEALDALPEVEVRRNFKALPKLRPGRPVTLIYTGVPHQAVWTEPELAAFDNLVATGSRAVFTFHPVETPPTKIEEERSGTKARVEKKEQLKRERPAKEKRDSKTEKKAKTEKPKEKPAADRAEHDEKDFVDFATVAKRWGFEFAFLPEDKKAFHREASLVEPGGQLEPDISWHSALYFRDLKPQWKVLYMCGTMPVVMERRFGDGSIVLVADSYVVSNEALSKERHPRFLARLFRGPALVIFDEESHGLRENPGIASLVGKYRLYGVVGGLFLLALLFVWKNAVRFIPAHQPQFAEGDVVAGKESGEGFVNLLRRSIRPARIFETCWNEGRKALAHRPRELAAVEQIWADEQSRPARDRDPVATYRAISRVLHHKS